jgi:hypothetical protein
VRNGSSVEWRSLGHHTSIEYVDIRTAISVPKALVEPYSAESVGLRSVRRFQYSRSNVPWYAYHLRVNQRNQLVAAGHRSNPSREPRWLGGKWLYGGELMHHFGHFMSES